MALRVYKVLTHDKGIVDEINDDEIPKGSASASNNFLHLGDRIELVRGQVIFGNRITGAGENDGVVTGRDVGGTEHSFRYKEGSFQYYVVGTETWTDIVGGTGLTDEPMSFALYRTPAGSFIWASSPSTGLYRINLSNPTNITDFYDATKNYRGYITFQDNRMMVWKVKNNESVLYLSWIDNDFPYTAISNENWGTGDNIEVTFTGTAVKPHLVGRTVTVTDTVETFTDDGLGTLTGDAGGTGTINYVTGAYSVTFNSAPAGSQAILAGYQYEEPDSEGVADFRYTTPTRVAGEGDFFFQGQGNDEIQTVLGFNEKYYSMHDENLWRVDLTADDTDATNKIYRENTGVPFLRSAIATGDGIYYVDESDSDNKKLRLLKFDKFGTKIIPVPISDQINLNDFDFSASATVKYGDMIIWSCKSSGVSYNDTFIIYNTKWQLIDKMDGFANDFMIRGDKLYAASSVDRNVYQIFTGFDDDDEIIDGVYETQNTTLETDELKKVKYLTVEGRIATSQILQVEASYDGGDYTLLGTISGDSQYVDAGDTTEYGLDFYGSTSLGTGDTISVAKYLRRFKVSNDKFYRVKLRFKNLDLGYLSIQRYSFEDIRKKRLREASKFR